MATEESAYLPTADDVRFYREHGYWMSPAIVADDVLDAAEKGMARFYAGDVDGLLSVDSRPRLGGAYSHWGWRPEDGNIMRKNDYVTLRVRELAQLAHLPVIARCAAVLSGFDSLRLWHDQLLYKPLDDGHNKANVIWHTDRHFWRTCSSGEMLTAWIPFSDVTAEDGAMCVVDGSHRWSEELDLHWGTAPFSVIEEVVRERQASLVPVELERGQFSLHHCKTIHGSGANHGRSPRRSLVVHMQPASNHYIANGHAHANDDLVRRDDDGLPDYTDPGICPVLYP